ncbi:hypothetical protein [Metaclostridioides mangenotii]|uniref:hypothetical protein n=1 Tax=Metaclostridioides mangenotii TaxID=1540 RepID=UPI000466AE82|nr:hypothetical protein [Clostridioides mangenotii]
MKVVFTIPGECVSKDRPRFNNGHARIVFGFLITITFVLDIVTVIYYEKKNRKFKLDFYKNQY